MPKLKEPRTHGMVTMYWSGCRCQPCSLANRKYCSDYTKTEKGKLAKDRAGKKFRASPYGKQDQRRRDLQRHFGLTLEEYDALLLKQNNVCAICKLPRQKYRLAVDHDHTTNQIRGILCGTCNTGLGKFRDNPQLLLSAIEYLNCGRVA